MSDTELGETFSRWARLQPSIRVLVMIGSRTRQQAGPGAADEGSDWDFQVVTSQPDLFSNGAWTGSAKLSKPLVYASRRGRLGRVTKVSSVFREGELDLVILPLNQLRLGKSLLESRLLRFFPSAQRALAELALVLMPGYRVLKGPASWERFFHRIVLEIAPQRLSNPEICAMGEAFVCDYISTCRKIARGELLAAQRWLHCQLAETNFQLLHELKLRQGQPSYPDARRIEMLAPDRWREFVKIDAAPERESLSCAVEKSRQACRELMMALVGSNWRWPDLIVPSSLKEKSGRDRINDSH